LFTIDDFGIASVLLLSPSAEPISQLSRQLTQYHILNYFLAISGPTVLCHAGNNRANRSIHSQSTISVSLKLEHYGEIQKDPQIRCGQKDNQP
jgi:hypothetical protein